MFLYCNVPYIVMFPYHTSQCSRIVMFLYGNVPSILPHNVPVLKYSQYCNVPSILPHNVPCRAVQTPGCAQRSRRAETARRVRGWRVRSPAERPTYHRGTEDAVAAAAAASRWCQTWPTGSADCCLQHWSHHHHRHSWIYITRTINITAKVARFFWRMCLPNTGKN